MQTVNPILANALDLLKQGNAELAEKEFAKAATACCKAFGEVRYTTGTLFRRTYISHSVRATLYCPITSMYDICDVCVLSVS